MAMTTLNLTPSSQKTKHQPKTSLFFRPVVISNATKQHLLVSERAGSWFSWCSPERWSWKCVYIIIERVVKREPTLCTLVSLTDGGGFLCGLFTTPANPMVYTNEKPSYSFSTVPHIFVKSLFLSLSFSLSLNQTYSTKVKEVYASKKFNIGDKADHPSFLSY